MDDGYSGRGLGGTEGSVRGSATVTSMDWVP